MDKPPNIADGAPGATPSRNSTRSSHPPPARESSTTSLRRTGSEPTKHTAPTSGATSASTSAAVSPMASRDSSPNRPSLRTGAAKAASTGATGTRSRQNSQPDTSPSRPSKSSIPTATTQRALSASTTPSLLPASSESTIRAPVPQKPQVATEQSKEAPRWPVSPRLRSPPPVLNKPNFGALRKGDQDPPTISVQRSTPSPQPPFESVHSDTDLDDVHLQPGMRTPARSAGGSTSTLETVQEASPLGSPQALDSALEKLEEGITTDPGSQPEVSEVSVTKTFKANPSLVQTESGSESGSIKADRRSTPTTLPPQLTSRQSSTSTRPNGGKGKPGEGSLQNMTVETETVTSIPEIAVGPASVQPPGGSLRTNGSQETIRPKKDLKKKKTSTVTSGTASSKADFFEASIASAVDADVSDSEETYVYDSNPPDGRDRPQRFHSRTPSATSMASQIDRNGMRSIHSVMEGPGPSMAVKKNMKFVNNVGSGTESWMGDDEGKGTGRSNAGSGRGTTRHHHVGRWARNVPGNGHPSLFDNESPFPLNAARSKFGSGNNASSRQSSGPPSPRLNPSRGNGNGKRGFPFPGYDLDETTGADDERTPLMPSSTRSPRNARRSRHNMTSRELERQAYRQPPSLLNRLASCLVVSVMVMVVISAAIGFMFATSQPLEGVALVQIDQVIATEEQLVFNIKVQAHNPNAVVVSVDAGKIDVFAKSPHAGTDSRWWRRPHHGDSLAMEDADGDDVELLESSGKPDNSSAPNMLLGEITEFEYPLSFEGSFFSHGVSSSSAELKLRRPGNGTEDGAERWQRILEDEFILIVNGPLKYSLPLSQRIRSSQISGKVTVKPNAADDPTLQPKPNSTDFTTP